MYVSVHVANGRQTMEVATARVYNWEVVQKRKDKTDEEDEQDKSGKSEDPNR